MLVQVHADPPLGCSPLAVQMLALGRRGAPDVSCREASNARSLRPSGNSTPGEMHMPAERGTEIIPYIFYRDVPAALDFLSRAFGFTELMRIGKPSGMHAEMTLDGQRIMMGQGSKDWGMVAPIEAGAA